MKMAAVEMIFLWQPTGRKEEIEHKMLHFQFCLRFFYSRLNYVSSENARWVYPDCL